MKFAVVSAVEEMDPILIEGEGNGPRVAKRHALGVARKQGIAKPIVIPEHEAARQMRLRVEAMRPTMPRNLNGNSAPFWKQPARELDLNAVK
ncbi:MAG: hypothetical protein KW802_01410 [Candidatus Doudnabacteria bacterium]|nr:hypothetical protein [Candidatus Doudnabacteria bacterium]